MEKTYFSRALFENRMRDLTSADVQKCPKMSGLAQACFLEFTNLLSVFTNSRPPRQNVWTLPQPAARGFALSESRVCEVAHSHVRFCPLLSAFRPENSSARPQICIFPEQFRKTEASREQGADICSPLHAARRVTATTPRAIPRSR